MSSELEEGSDCPKGIMKVTQKDSVSLVDQPHGGKPATQLYIPISTRGHRRPNKLVPLEISTHEINLFKSLNLDDDFINELLDPDYSVKYHEFPKKFSQFNLGKMIVNMKEKHAAFVEDPNSINTTIKIGSQRFSTKGKLSEDLFVMAVTAALVGTNIDSVIKKCNTIPTQNYLKVLRIKYMMPSTVKGRGIKSNSVTLARVANWNAPVMFHLAHMGLIRNRVSMEDILLDCDARCLNHTFMSTIWPIMISNDFVYLLEYRLSFLLKRGNPDKTIVIKKRVDASINNKYYPNSVRVNIFSKYGLFVNGAPSQNFLSALGRATEKWKGIQEEEN